MSDLEIERKFVVVDKDFISSLDEGTVIVQGYFPSSSGLTVRVRHHVAAGTYRLTVKSARKHRTRSEREQSLKPDVGDAMLQAASGCSVRKRRVPVVGSDGNRWIVDVFDGANRGLVLAEIELESSDAEFELPAWCGPEVTEDDRYYNEYLAKIPFSSWRDEVDGRH